MENSILVGIITGSAGIVGAIGSQIVNAVTSSRREKRALAERIFNHLFPERIKAHEDIIRGVHEVGIPELVTLESIPDNGRELLTNMADTVGRLWVRYQVTASTKVLKPLIDLGVTLRQAAVIIGCKTADEAIDAFAKSTRRCHALYFKLLEGVREESSASLTDDARDFVLEEVRKLTTKNVTPNDTANEVINRP